MTLQRLGSLHALATSYTAAWSLPRPDSHRQVEYSFEDAPQEGHFALPTTKLTFLATELARLKADRAELKRAIILAVHHPPVSSDSTHGSSPTMANEIDSIHSAAGVWPDLVLSGHAHLYQRFSRSVGGRSIPVIVAGSGGHLARAPRTDLPPVGSDIGNYRMEIEPIFELGYLTVTVDLNSTAKPTLTGTFNSQAQNPTRDTFVLNLADGTVNERPNRRCSGPT